MLHFTHKRTHIHTLANDLISHGDMIIIHTYTHPRTRAEAYAHLLARCQAGPMFQWMRRYDYWPPPPYSHALMQKLTDNYNSNYIRIASTRASKSSALTALLCRIDQRCEWSAARGETTRARRRRNFFFSSIECNVCIPSFFTIPIVYAYTSTNIHIIYLKNSKKFALCVYHVACMHVRGACVSEFSIF